MKKRLLLLCCTRMTFILLRSLLHLYIYKLRNPVGLVQLKLVIRHIHTYIHTYIYKIKGEREEE